MVYSRIINRKELTFGHAGRTLRNAIVFYDTATNSFWSQFVGEAVQGDYTGTSLELIPSMITTWEKWKKEYPDTVAMKTNETTMMQKMMQNMNKSYYASSTTMMGEFVEDVRLSAKEFVLGYAHGSVSKAYSIKNLVKNKIYNEVLNEIPILVGYHVPTNSSKIFDRFVMGKELTFEYAGPNEDGTEIVIDVETGTSWRLLDGLAIEGTLKGSTLQILPSHLSYWFAWTDHYPNTDLN
jgi:hypothetical protein